MCHSHLTTIVNSNFHGKIKEIACIRFETFHGRLHSATSISKRRITLANFVRHLTYFNSKEGFTTTFITTQELSRSLLLCNNRKHVIKCSVHVHFSDILAPHYCLHNLLYLHDKTPFLMGQL